MHPEMILLLFFSFSKRSSIVGNIKQASPFDIGLDPNFPQRYEIPDSDCAKGTMNKGSGANVAPVWSLAYWRPLRTTT